MNLIKPKVIEGGNQVAPLWTMRCNLISFARGNFVDSVMEFRFHNVHEINQILNPALLPCESVGLSVRQYVN